MANKTFGDAINDVGFNEAAKLLGKRTKAPTVDIDLVRGPIMTTWSAIGYDSLAEGPIPNTAAVEACIDANRLTSFAQGERGKTAAQAAEAEIERAIAAHGYPKVLRALARAIVLC